MSLDSKGKGVFEIVSLGWENALEKEELKWEILVAETDTPILLCYESVKCYNHDEKCVNITS